MLRSSACAKIKRVLRGFTRSLFTDLIDFSWPGSLRLPVGFLLVAEAVAAMHGGSRHGPQSLGRAADTRLAVSLRVIT